MFELRTAGAIFCSVVGLAFIGLWLYYDRRDHESFERERRMITFHCIRCGRLYTAPGASELCRCPRCGHENTRLRF